MVNEADRLGGRKGRKNKSFDRKSSRPIDISSFKHLYPFSSHYMNIRGLKYHYVDEGAGEPLMMVHGNPTWSFYFRKLIKAFSPCYRTLAPDHIGCGLSEKPDEKQYDFRLKSRVEDLETFLSRLKPKGKLNLILHDWGGIIGMAYAVRYPDQIGRIIILNTSAFFPPQGKPLPWQLKLVRNLPFISRPAVQGLNVFALGALIMASKKKLSRSVKKGLVAPYNSWNNRLSTFKFVQDIPLVATDPSHRIVQHTQENLSRLKEKPMLICWGMKDFVFDSDYLAMWSQLFPNAQICRFWDAGHYVLEDAPDRIIEAIGHFL